jgi:ADP-ribose pyrophosphatase YjhB (NUDIX family)
MTHLKTKIAEYGIIVHEKKFLVLKFSKKTNIGEKWIFPGGRLNEGEGPITGLTREIREETGLEVEIIQPVHVGMWGIAEDKRYAVFFLCTLNNGQVTLSHEHDAYRWCEFSNIDTVDFHDASLKEAVRNTKKILGL